MSKIILDLCGGTGAWSKPYADAGYDVRNITLPEYDVCTYEPPAKVYGVLAAPPCTMFSFARTTAKSKRDFRAGMKEVIACLNIIWECRSRGKLTFWCLENPTGYLRQFLGKPPYTFKPCEFGDSSAKRTDLWGYFEYPKKLKTPAKTTPGSHRESGWYKNITKNRPVERAITPPGFAQAFFEANR